MQSVASCETVATADALSSFAVSIVRAAHFEKNE
jgi:hypothetical protein